MKDDLILFLSFCVERTCNKFLITIPPTLKPESILGRSVRKVALKYIYPCIEPDQFHITPGRMTWHLLSNRTINSCANMVHFLLDSSRRCGWIWWWQNRCNFEYTFEYKWDTLRGVQLGENKERGRGQGAGSLRWLYWLIISSIHYHDATTFDTIKCNFLKQSRNGWMVGMEWMSDSNGKRLNNYRSFGRGLGWLGTTFTACPVAIHIFTGDTDRYRKYCSQLIASCKINLWGIYYKI